MSEHHPSDPKGTARVLTHRAVPISLREDSMTRDDWLQMLRDIPAAIVVLAALWAFMALMFAVVPS